MAMVVHGYFEFEYCRQRSKVAPGDEFFYTQPSGSERKVRAARKCTYYTQPSRLSATRDVITYYHSMNSAVDCRH